MAHPKEEVTKTYLVKLDGAPQPHQLEKLKKGVSIVGGKVSARHIERIHKQGDKKSDKYEWFKIVITEGKNRQIRQMFEKVGFDVMKLQRVAIGRLRIGALKTGEIAFLTPETVERVFLPDDPEEVKTKRTYKGRAQASAAKKAGPSGKRAPSGSRKVQAYKAKTAETKAPAKSVGKSAAKPAAKSKRS
ncbi:Ribosomal large subunit pseudouridine synthase B [compost metagenome]